MNSTLIILGAGCSFRSGYPLANNSFPRLTEFRDSLGDEAVKLRGFVTRTLDLVKTLREQGESVETLDTLARLLHEGKAGGNNMVEKNRPVLAAKVSVAALFPLNVKQFRNSCRATVNCLFVSLGITPSSAIEKQLNRPAIEFLHSITTDCSSWHSGNSFQILTAQRLCIARPF